MAGVQSLWGTMAGVQRGREPLKSSLLLECGKRPTRAPTARMSLWHSLQLNIVIAPINMFGSLPLCTPSIAPQRPPSTPSGTPIQDRLWSAKAGVQNLWGAMGELQRARKQMKTDWFHLYLHLNVRPALVRRLAKDHLGTPANDDFGIQGDVSKHNTSAVLLKTVISEALWFAVFLMFAASLDIRF